MIEAAQVCRDFILGRERDELESNVMLRFALVRAVEIIDEAASKTSLETRAAAPSVPWTAIISMRNRLVHAYFDVDNDILWQTATEEIPRLVSSLKAALRRK